MLRQRPRTEFSQNRDRVIVFGLLLEEGQARVRSAARESFSDGMSLRSISYSLVNQAPADTADTQERLQIFSPHIRHVRAARLDFLLPTIDMPVSVGDEHSLCGSPSSPLSPLHSTRFRVIVHRIIAGQRLHPPDRAPVFPSSSSAIIGVE